jgi:hypothetical protein
MLRTTPWASSAKARFVPHDAMPTRHINSLNICIVCTLLLGFNLKQQQAIQVLGAVRAPVFDSREMRLTT